jgi:hypothetical protein
MLLHLCDGPGEATALLMATYIEVCLRFNKNPMTTDEMASCADFMIRSARPPQCDLN